MCRVIVYVISVFHGDIRHYHYFQDQLTRLTHRSFILGVLDMSCYVMLLVHFIFIKLIISHTNGRKPNWYDFNSFYRFSPEHLKLFFPVQFLFRIYIRLFDTIPYVFDSTASATYRVFAAFPSRIHNSYILIQNDAFVKPSVGINAYRRHNF